MQYAIHVVNILDMIAMFYFLTRDHLHIEPRILTWVPPNTDLESSVPLGLLVGTVLMSLGGVLRVRSYRHLGRYFTLRLSIKRDHRLVTSGPYGVVRHPSYTAIMLYMLGIVFAHLGPASIFSELGLWRRPLGMALGLCQVLNILVAFATIFKRVVKEDAVLKEQFGDDWVAWRERTPRRLFPGIY